MNANMLRTLVVGVIIGGTVMVARSLGQSGPTGGAGKTVRARSGVCVIDLVRVFNETAQISDLNELIRQKESDLQAEAKQRQKVIEDKQIELSAFQAGTADYDSRRKDLVRLNIEANVWLKTSQQDLEQEKFQWTRIIYENTLKIAENLAQEQECDIVLQSKPFRPTRIDQTIDSIQRLIKGRTVIYAAAEIDITDRVIRRLDAEYKAAGGKRQLSPTARSTKPVP